MNDPERGDVVFLSPSADATKASAVGNYERAPVQNGWHHGNILVSKKRGFEGALYWQNGAQTRWWLTPDIREGVLRTAQDNPYWSYGKTANRVFKLDIGEQGVRGFWFNNEYYKKRR